MAAKRKSTGKRLRFTVFKRDRFTCQYCGRTPPLVVLVVDHILPVASGGETIESNLITACETCNQGKADKTLEDAPPGLLSRLQRQVESAEQMRELNKLLLAERRKNESMARELVLRWDELAGTHSSVSTAEMMATMRRFLGRLPASELYEAIDIAMSRKPVQYSDAATFKYFCGVCWSKIKQREDGPA